MYICSNCKATSEAKINFCPVCGGTMTEVAPAAPTYTQPTPNYSQPNYTQPNYTQPTYSQPTYSQPTPTYSQPVYYQPAPQYSKAKSIVGMALAIAGLFFAFFGFIYTALYASFDEVLGFSMAFAFSIFSLPPAIIGLKFSNSNADLGDTSAFVRVGKILGIIGLILSCIMLFVGFICLTGM